MGRCKDALLQSEAGPFANYVPYTHHTGRVLETLAEYSPKTLAIMHGSTYYGDGQQVSLRSTVMSDVLGPEAQGRRRRTCLSNVRRPAGLWQSL